MDSRARLLRGLAAAVLVTAPLSPLAQVLFDDGKVRVQEMRFKPGDEGPKVVRPFRVIRVLEGGTMRRIFPDGRVVDVEYKTGETRVYQPDEKFSIRNVGKTDIVLFVVAVRAGEK